VGNKIPKTTGIFDDVDHPKSRWVTHWAERIEPLVDHIIQVSRSAAFRAISKNYMLFFEYFKIGCMYLDNFFIIWKVWSGAMLFTISCTVTSITAFSVTKKLKKSWAELKQHYSVYSNPPTTQYWSHNHHISQSKPWCSAPKQLWNFKYLLDLVSVTCIPFIYILCIQDKSKSTYSYNSILKPQPPYIPVWTMMYSTKAVMKL
jgi:hypothetical protein